MSNSYLDPAMNVDGGEKEKRGLNTVIDGIITLSASDGTIESANPAAEHMFGYTLQSLAGRT